MTRSTADRHGMGSRSKPQQADQREHEPGDEYGEQEPVQAEFDDGSCHENRFGVKNHN